MNPDSPEPVENHPSAAPSVPLDHQTPLPTAPSIHRDIFSAYLVTFSRVAAWLVVTASVVRIAGKPAFALLGLIQSTVGILEYAAIGLSPAIIRLTAEAMRESRDNGKITSPDDPLPSSEILIVYANGFAMALLTAVIGGVALVAFMPWFKSTQTNIESGNVAFELALMVAIATILRMMSDAPGAALQTRSRIFADNLLLTMHEVVWGVGTFIDLRFFHLPWQRATGFALLAGSLALLIFRSILSHVYGSGLFARWWVHIRGPMVGRLLIFGGMVVASQMADYLYAPTNNLIITKEIGWRAVGDYGPAVQIDGGMLLLAMALASVLLPRTAIAHGQGDLATVRRYYIYGTVASALILLVFAPFLWLLAPAIFRIWLGNRMTATCQILPWMLIHSIIGGSSATGRSILLAIGKVKTFTLSVLIAGIANVILSFCFVRYFNMGLFGIVLGTNIAVLGRCAIWLPWYTMRVLQNQQFEEETPLLGTLPPAPMP